MRRNTRRYYDCAFHGFYRLSAYPNLAAGNCPRCGRPGRYMGRITLLSGYWPKAS